MTFHRFATALLLLSLAALAAPAAAQPSSDFGLTGVRVTGESATGDEYSQTLKFYGSTPLLLVASDISSIRVTPRPAHSRAQTTVLYVNNGNKSSTDPTVEVPLTADYSERITVQVLAEDGINGQNYHFGVTRLDAPTTLSYTAPADGLRVGDRVSLAADFGGLGGGHGTYAKAYSTISFARRLPEGLYLNPNTGLISGTLRLSQGARTVRIVAVAIPGLGVKAEAEIAFPEVVYEESETATAPGEPTGVNVTVPGGNFVVRWNPPLEDNGAEVTGYTATATPAPGEDGATATCESDGENTGGQGPLPYCYIRYDALTAGADYHVTVTATNSAGTSGPSVAFRWRVPEFLLGGPGAPTLMAVSGDATVTLSWTLGDNGGNAVVKWQYRQIGHGGWTNVPDSGPGGENEAGYTVTGLTNGIEYTFKVRAVNAFWGGVASVARAATPLAPLPSFDAGPPGAQSYTAGHDIADLTLSAASGGTGTLTYTLTGPNDQALADAVRGLSFNTGTRVLSRTPHEEATSGRVVLTYRVTDSMGEFDSQTFPVTVYPPLTLSASTLTLASNELRSRTLQAAAVGGRLPRTYTLTGPDGQALAEAVPGLSFNSISKLLRGTPTVPALPIDLTYTATDTNGATASATLTMTVAGVIVTEGPTEVTENAGDVTYMVRLTSQPTNDVTVNVRRLSGPEGVVDFPSGWVTFTASNWATPQGLTVTILNNGVANADSEVLLVFRTTSFGDAHYSGSSGWGTHALTVTDVEAVSVPLPPTLTAAEGENTVTLSWVSGGNGGSPIVKYQHRYREEASTWPWAIWQDVPDSNPNSDPVGANAAGYTVPYLGSDVLYFFQVRAVSEAGIGNTSDEASAMSVRSPPAELSVADASVAESDGATLDFVVTLNREPRPRALVLFNFATHDGTATAPEDYTAVSERVRGDRNIHSKTDHEDGSTTWTISVPVVNDETDEGSETLTLRLSNAHGVRIVDGEATGTIHDPAATRGAAAAQQQQRPPAPTLVAEAGDGQVTLSWTSGGDGGSAITKWRYRKKKASASRYGAWTDIPDSAPGGENVAGYTVTDLANGAAYTFKVRAVNALGDGVVSVAQTATPVGAQRPPAPTLAAEAGDGQVTLSWTSGGDGGSAIAKWRYRQKKAGSRRYGAWTDIPDSAPGGENVAGYTVTGLANGTAYTFKVRAVNALGDGTVSVAQTATPVAPVPGISVADAEVDEESGEPLRFSVRLDALAGTAVSVRYRTANGTAVAGQDYVAKDGTVRFAPGETEQEVEVQVLQDSHDEGSETLTLTLSAPDGATLADATATGTISNSDPIPNAWIARFGRTVADQVLDAVQGRMRAGRQAGAEVSLGGERIGLGPLFGAGGDAASGTGEARATAAREAEAERAAGELAAWLKGGTDAERQGFGARTGSAGRGRSMDGRELLLGSSFALTAETAGKGFVSIWGRGAVTRFDGREGALSLDGEVTSAMLGTDWSQGPLTTGLVVSHSLGEGGYRDGSGENGSGAGTISATLTGLYPWLRHALTDRLEAWGVAGYDAGSLTLEPGDGPAIRTDLDLWMAAVGLRGTVLDGGGDGLTLTATPDAMIVGTSTDAVSGLQTGNLAAADARVTRLRVGLEGTLPVGLADGSVLTPGFEIGVRHDGGDAETGLGADIGAGLAWRDARRGLAAELRGRGLLTHEAKGFRERGLSGSFSWEPVSGGRGPRLSLAQTIGGSSSGGADALLGRGALEGLAANDNGEDLKRRRLEARFGYGVAAFGDRYTWTPEVGVGLSDTGRDYSLGWRLTDGLSGNGGAFALSFEALRRESANDNTGPEHEVGLRLTTRF